jgi:hypothetical protein
MGAVHIGLEESVLVASNSKSMSYRIYHLSLLARSWSRIG